MRSNTVDAIKALVLHELECRRTELGHDELVNLTIVIKLDQHGIPRRILWRPEYASEYLKEPRSNGKGT